VINAVSFDSNIGFAATLTLVSQKGNHIIRLFQFISIRRKRNSEAKPISSSQSEIGIILTQRSVLAREVNIR
jgi:hypothetical protein